MLQIVARFVENLITFFNPFSKGPSAHFLQLPGFVAALPGVRFAFLINVLKCICIDVLKKEKGTVRRRTFKLKIWSHLEPEHNKKQSVIKIYKVERGGERFAGVFQKVQEWRRTRGEGAQKKKKRKNLRFRRRRRPCARVLLYGIWRNPIFKLFGGPLNNESSCLTNC